MWTPPHFGQLTRKKILLDITYISSKLPALKPLCREYKSLFTLQAYWDITQVQKWFST